MPRTRKPGRSRPRIVLGLMSGTSGDGVDAASVAISGSGEQMDARFVRHWHRPFRPGLRRRLLEVMAPAATRTEAIAGLHSDLGRVFADVALEAIEDSPRARRPTLIGMAGQTVAHLPHRRPGKTVTMQLGEAAIVAEKTGLTVISGFRQSDVAAGGQGAPLVSWTDYVLYRGAEHSRAIQNIGGIGNVTWLPSRCKAEDVIAFDTGPGNMIIDALMSEATNGRQTYDRNGRHAARGCVLNDVLDEWMKHPYFRRKPPKTTGRELFGHPFIQRALKRLRRASSSTDDWVATATAFTARSISASYNRYLFDLGRHSETKGELIVCGGGAHNATLLAMLSHELPGWQVRSIESDGIPTQAKEALSFAMLAAACLDGAPTNLPGATGALRRAVLGQRIDRR